MARKTVPLSLEILYRRSVILIMVILMMALLKLGQEVFVPLALAIFLVAIAWPIKTWLNRHLPPSISYIGSFIALGGVLAAFVLALYFCTAEIAETAPKYQSEIKRFWKETKYELAMNGVDTTAKVKLDELRLVAGIIFQNFQQALVALVLVIAYVMLAMPEVASWKVKLRSCMSKEKSDKIISTAEELGRSFQHYLAASVGCSIISALATYAIALIFGLDFALSWGILAFFLNFIPVVGAFLTVIPPVLLAFLQFDGLETPLTLLAVMGTVHMFIGNIIEPRVQGNMLAMSPLVVLISLSVWGFLWGIPGALLAAPLTHGVIIAFSHYHQTRWIACLLSEEPQNTCQYKEKAT